MYTLNMDSLAYQYSKMTVVQLRQYIDDHKLGIKKSGRKNELVERIINTISAAESQALPKQKVVGKPIITKNNIITTSVTLVTAGDIVSGKKVHVLQLEYSDIDYTEIHDHKTLLMYACMHSQQSNIIKYLCTKCNVNAVDDKGKTALMYTCIYAQKADIILELINAGAELNVKDDNGCTALLYALMYEPSNRVIELLIKSGADVNIRRRDLASPLMLVYDDSVLTKLFLNHDASIIGVKNSFGYTALTMACTDNFALSTLVSMRYMLKHVTKKYGSDAARDLVNDADYQGDTPLLTVIKHSNSYEMAKLLLEYGADVNTRDEANTSPLQIECTAENYDMIQLLLDHGADTKGLKASNDVKDYITKYTQDTSQESCDEVQESCDEVQESCDEVQESDTNSQEGPLDEYIESTLADIEQIHVQEWVQVFKYTILSNAISDTESIDNVMLLVPIDAVNEEKTNSTLITSIKTNTTDGCKYKHVTINVTDTYSVRKLIARIDGVYYFMLPSFIDKWLVKLNQ